MSFALLAMTIFLGPSLVVAFVLPLSQEETEASTIPLVSGRNGCQSDVSMATIRKRLLESLNLQTEPQLPAGQLTSIREQWKNMFSATDHKSKGPTVSEISETHGGGNSTALKCCQMASQILLKDLGWDNWVIYPETFTFVQCTSCYQNTARCPSHPSTVDENTSQIQCCEPMSKEMVPIVYMDDLSTLVISSVQLTRTCGCSQGKLHSDE